MDLIFLSEAKQVVLITNISVLEKAIFIFPASYFLTIAIHKVGHQDIFHNACSQELTQQSTVKIESQN